jgi:hypothetical protein
MPDDPRLDTTGDGYGAGCVWALLLTLLVAVGMWWLLI